MSFFGLDLKHLPTICDPARNSLVGGTHEPGQIGVCANHAAFADDDVSPLCGALWPRAQGQEFFLPRPLSLHGFCSTDLSRAKTSTHPCVASDSKTPQPASGWCFSPTISSCRRSPSPSFIVAGGKSSCFSNGSSSIS